MPVRWREVFLLLVCWIACACALAAPPAHGTSAVHAELDSRLPGAQELDMAAALERGLEEDDEDEEACEKVVAKGLTMVGKVFYADMQETAKNRHMFAMCRALCQVALEVNSGEDGDPYRIDDFLTRNCFDADMQPWSWTTKGEDNKRMKAAAKSFGQRIMSQAAKKLEDQAEDRVLETIAKSMDVGEFAQLHIDFNMVQSVSDPFTTLVDICTYTTDWDVMLLNDWEIYDKSWGRPSGPMLGTGCADRRGSGKHFKQYRSIFRDFHRLLPALIYDGRHPTLAAYVDNRPDLRKYIGFPNGSMDASGNPVLEWRVDDDQMKKLNQLVWDEAFKVCDLWRNYCPCDGDEWDLQGDTLTNNSWVHFSQLSPWRCLSAIKMVKENEASALRPLMPGPQLQNYCRTKCREKMPANSVLGRLYTGATRFWDWAAGDTGSPKQVPPGYEKFCLEESVSCAADSTPTNVQRIYSESKDGFGVLTSSIGLGLTNPAPFYETMSLERAERTAAAAAAAATAQNGQQQQKQPCQYFVF